MPKVKEIDVSEEYKLFQKNNNSCDLTNAIKHVLLQQGYDLKKIYLRFVRQENIQRIEKYGTDRIAPLDCDGKNPLSFDNILSGVDKEICREKPWLQPKDFTYILKPEFFHLSALHIKRQQLKGTKSDLTYLREGEISDRVMMLVYNQSGMIGLEKMQARMFVKDPKDVLIGTYTLKLN